MSLTSPSHYRFHSCDWWWHYSYFVCSFWIITMQTLHKLTKCNGLTTFTEVASTHTHNHILINFDLCQRNFIKAIALVVYMVYSCTIVTVYNIIGWAEVSPTNRTSNRTWIFPATVAILFPCFPLWKRCVLGKLSIMSCNKSTSRSIMLGRVTT